MCSPVALMAASAGAQTVGAYNSAKAQQASLLYDAQTADNNAQLAEWQAQDAVTRGNLDEQSVRMRAAAVKASQRAAMAANGIDVTQGSAADIQTSTDYMGERDAFTVRNDALRSAWGYRTQGASYRDSAGMSRAGASSIRPSVSAATTLLGSATLVSSAWDAERRAGIPSLWDKLTKG